MKIPPARDLIASAASALKDRVDEVNRLNVFPVPDGDTGTNMSLTMDTVVSEVTRLRHDASVAEVCHAVTHASLMGARGNSGVILSQILRGLCEGIDGADTFDVASLAQALGRARDVAYQAVRKPVEGTMLTVTKDVAESAERALEAGDDLPTALERVSAAAKESVKRTPELLAVLKENGVVDAGGHGLSIMIEGFAAAVLGRAVTVADVSDTGRPMLAVEPVDDWDDSEYLYCTEFLLFGEGIERDAVHDFVSAAGGSELVVGDDGAYKVHVHTNDPASVLAHVTSLGEVAEVHINNMRRQSAERDAMLRDERGSTPPKPVGFVAVAAGPGLSEILMSLGADVVVSGGQTMNPSTADLAEAVARVNAHKVIILPDNKNIIMAANAAASVSDKPVAVVPTRSVPQGFAALLAFDGSDDLDSVVSEMTEAAGFVRTGEVTTAIKDAKGKAGAIRAGQVIGIVDDEDIEVAGESVDAVSRELARVLLADGDRESLTLFAGKDMDDDAFTELAESIAADHPDVSVETHRGDQPLYPLIMSAE